MINISYLYTVSLCSVLLHNWLCLLCLQVI